MVSLSSDAIPGFSARPAGLHGADGVSSKDVHKEEI